jgi:nicotinamidase/pyrazinamidase
MKTLIVTDIQNDFMPGGALGVPGADQLIPLINTLMPKFSHVIATLDWHPPHHVSFASTHRKKIGEEIVVGKTRQILWPDHCLQNSHGAALAPGLRQDLIEKEFHKGVDPKIDSYSVFFDSARHRSTGLHDYLQEKKISELYFVGVALEYCVFYSVMDALEMGYSVTVIDDACRAINLHANDGEKALQAMQKKGARVQHSSQFLK